MKFYRNALLLVLFAIVNYYGIQYGFLGLNTANDFAFIGGFVGLVILFITDVLIIWRVIKTYAKKAEDSLCQEKATLAAEASAPSPSPAPTTQQASETSK